MNDQGVVSGQWSVVSGQWSCRFREHCHVVATINIYRELVHLRGQRSLWRFRRHFQVLRYISVNF